jgi:hypothetical protein
MPRRIAALAVVVLAVPGCGGGDRQDKNEKSGTYNVEILSAKFPAKQRLADQTQFEVVVRNADNKTIPDVSVTISGDPAKPAQAFGERSAQTGLADPSRPLWIVDDGPRGGTTAYVNTWALGALAPGKTKRFVWRVTAVTPGVHKISFKVNAGLDGKAKAQLPGGGAPGSAFTVNVSDKPPSSKVDDNGNVVRSPAA